MKLTHAYILLCLVMVAFPTIPDTEDLFLLKVAIGVIWAVVFVLVLGRSIKQLKAYQKKA